MSVPNLIIAGVEISLHEWPAQQRYEPLTGAALRRMANGAAHNQQHWRKIKTTIDGDGWAPPALAGIDWSAIFTLGCITPRSIASATTGATLPTARRSDAAPYAMALVSGKLVSTPVSLVSDAATATAVSGASGYRFFYYPSLACYSSGPQEGYATESGAFGWSLEAEEV